MGMYHKEAKELLALIGGKGNIAAVSHCMTRMRFVLNEPQKANIAGIEAIQEVKGSFTQAGQFQIIIGNAVADFYKDFTAVAGIDGEAKENVKRDAVKKRNILQRIITVLAEIFAPLLPAIITGGLIMGFKNCICGIYVFENGTKALCQISQFWCGIDSFLKLIGDAVFYMLPVGICWSVTKKMGTTQSLGIVLGLTLVSGQLLNAYSVATTAAADIPVWDFGYFKINMIGYQAQVLPAIMAAFTLVYLEKFFKKIVPQVISMILVPFCSLLLAVIAAHFVLGPLGWKLGSAISAYVYAGITGPFKVVFAAAFGFFYAPLVITGLHHMSNAIDLQLIADYGGTMLYPMIALSNIAQGSAVLGMMILQKNDTHAQEVNVPAGISCYMGVTEPAMFGVNLKYGFPFFCGMTGSACAAVLSVATGTTANALGVGGVPGILSMQTAYMGSFALAMAAAVSIPLVLTVLVGRRVLKVPEKTSKTELTELKAYVKGKVIPLKELGDGVFSEGIMGDGLAIIPENDVLYAPADARVAVVMEDTGHACGLTLENGVDLLLHIGLDTVEMQGEGFECLVKEGQMVKGGTPLIRFNRQKIEEAGHSAVAVCVITDGADEKKVRFHTGMDADENKTVIAEIEL